MASRAQMGVEFFVIMGFILLAAGVLIANSDRQIRETQVLNSIALARNALDSATSSAKYVYLSGQNAALTHSSFIPSNTSCYYFNTTSGKLYCLVRGANNTVSGDALQSPISINVSTSSCFNSGWLSVKVNNTNGTLIQISCT